MLLGETPGMEHFMRKWSDSDLTSSLVEIARVEALLLGEAFSFTYAQVPHTQLALLLHHRGRLIAFPGCSAFLASLLLLESEREWQA